MKLSLLYNFFLYLGGYVENQGPEVVGSLGENPSPKPPSTRYK